jgi:spore coat polysaccharide biosynthesis protein SpsF
MKIIATIEARMTSSRLPGKVLMRVKKKSFLEYLVERLRKIKELDEIILCTTRNNTDDILIKKAKELKIKFFRGSENNVLSRVVSAVKKYEADVVVQITADCPIIDYKIVEQAIKLFKSKKYDCVSNSFVRSFPDGMDVNVIKAKALYKTKLFAKTKPYKEHVTLFIKDNPKIFKIKNFIADKKNYWPELGVTLDEKKDYLLLRRIINYFYTKKYFFECNDIIKIVKKKNWISINNVVIRKGYNKKNLK